MTNDKKVNVAIIGTGFGAEFIPIYQKHPNANMYGVCRRNESELNKVADAFGVEKSTFLMRLSGDYQMPDERSYRWVDSETLLNIHTYWVDDPSSSSYYQEGTLGWDFTDQSGNTANLLSAASDLNLHFNRTNIIFFQKIGRDEQP